VSRVFKKFALIILFVSISIIFIDRAFDVIIGGIYGFIIILALLCIVPMCLLSMVMTDLSKTKKIIIIIYTLLLFPLGFFDFMGLKECSIKMNFYSQQTEFDIFADEIMRHDIIFQMSDGLRHFKKLNNKHITYSYDDTGTILSANYTHYYLDLLKKEGLDSITYEQFRNKLINLNVISFEEKIRFIYFEKDGFLNTCSGYLYVKGDVPPMVGREETFCGTIEYLLKLSDKWYYYVT